MNCRIVNPRCIIQQHHPLIVIGPTIKEDLEVFMFTKRNLIALIVSSLLVLASFGCAPPADPTPAPPGTTVEDNAPQPEPTPQETLEPTPPQDPPHQGEDELLLGDIHELQVHFIDVGQGDAVLIEAGNVVILIDAGPRSSGQIVVDYLVKRGIRELDIVIATHPHADHIGGLILVLETFPVHRIIDSGKPHTTVTFDHYLSQVEKQVEAGHCRYETPENQIISLGELTRLSILGPDRDLGSLNNNSVVCRLDHKDVSFLFTGDAEAPAEENLIQRGVNLAACVLKVGHHGSRSSTTAPFLSAVSPRYAVIQSGPDNSYGHPHDEVLGRLQARGVQIFRNDEQGTIVFITNGESISVGSPPWEATTVPGSPAHEEDMTGDGVNINSASLEELQRIIHIGEARAKEIEEKRPLGSLDELTRITGIGPARLGDIKDEGIAYVE